MHDPPTMSGFRYTWHAKKALHRIGKKGTASHSTLGPAATMIMMNFGHMFEIPVGTPSVLATA